jgi:hypothetical protein
LLEIWYNTNRHRDGRYLAENRTSSYQQIHAHKPLFGNQGKVLNLGHLDFDTPQRTPGRIVSTARCPAENFELRISDFASLGIFTLVKSPLQIRPFMQNKANFRKSQVNVTSFITKDYENKSNWTLGENKPNTNPKQTQLVAA